MNKEDITGDDWNEDLFWPINFNEGLHVVPRGCFLPNEDSIPWSSKELNDHHSVLITTSKFGFSFFAQKDTIRAWQFNKDVEECLKMVELKLLDHALPEDKKEVMSSPTSRLVFKIPKENECIVKLLLSLDETLLIAVTLNCKIYVFDLQCDFAHALKQQEETITKTILPSKTFNNLPSFIINTCVVGGSSSSNVLAAIGKLKEEDENALIIIDLESEKINKFSLPSSIQKSNGVNVPICLLSLQSSSLSRRCIVLGNNNKLECYEMVEQNLKQLWQVEGGEQRIGQIFQPKNKSNFLLVGCHPTAEQNGCVDLYEFENGMEQEPTRGWGVLDALNLFEKPLEVYHRYFFNYIENWKCFIINSTWSSSISLVGYWKDESNNNDGWGRWMLKCNREQSLCPEIIERTMWRLSERPLLTTSNAKSKKLFQESVFINSADLVMCVKRGVDPFFILGPGKELEGKAAYAPSPTLLFHTSDGIVVAFSLVDGDASTSSITIPSIPMPLKANFQPTTTTTTTTKTMEEVKNNNNSISKTGFTFQMPTSLKEEVLEEKKPLKNNNNNYSNIFSLPPPQVNASVVANINNNKNDVDSLFSSPTFGKGLFTNNNNNTAAGETISSFVTPMKQVDFFSPEEKKVEKVKSELPPLPSFSVKPKSTSKATITPPVANNNNNSMIKKKKEGNELAFIAYELSKDLELRMNELTTFYVQENETPFFDEEWLQERSQYMEKLSTHLADSSVWNELSELNDYIKTFQTLYFQIKWKLQDANERLNASFSSNASMSLLLQIDETYKRRVAFLKFQMEEMSNAVDLEIKMIERLKIVPTMVDGAETREYEDLQAKLKYLLSAYKRCVKDKHYLKLIDVEVNELLLKQYPFSLTSPTVSAQAAITTTTISKPPLFLKPTEVTETNNEDAMKTSRNVVIKKDTILALCGEMQNVSFQNNNEQQSLESTSLSELTRHLNESFSQIALRAKEGENEFKSKLSASKKKLDSIRAKLHGSSTDVITPLLKTLETVLNDRPVVAVESGISSSSNENKMLESFSKSFAKPVEFKIPQPSNKTEEVVVANDTPKKDALFEKTSSNLFTNPQLSSSAPLTQQPTTKSKTINLKQTLFEFYKLHNPEKLKDTTKIEAVATKYAANPEKLIQELQSKYPGKEVPIVYEEASTSVPTATAAASSSSSSFAPLSTTTNNTVNAFAGGMSFSSPPSAGVEKYATTRERLTAFYQKFNPEKVDTVEKTLQQYAGSENVMWDKLGSKYPQAKEWIQRTAGDVNTTTTSAFGGFGNNNNNNNKPMVVSSFGAAPLASSSTAAALPSTTNAFGQSAFGTSSFASPSGGFNASSSISPGLNNTFGNVSATTGGGFGTSPFRGNNNNNNSMGGGFGSTATSAANLSGFGGGGNTFSSTSGAFGATASSGGGGFGVFGGTQGSGTNVFGAPDSSFSIPKTDAFTKMRG